MRPISYLLCCCVALLMAFPAAAMVYSKESLTIISKRAPTPPPETKSDEEDDEEEKEAEEEAETQQNTAPILTRRPFFVEIMPMKTASFEWFQNRKQLAPGRGIMVVLEDRDELSLGWSNLETAYDVLFIRGTGRIQAIVPDLVLNDLTEPLEITGKIKAVLYLRSGTAQAQDIMPGDRVDHAMFKPAPIVLQ